MAGEWLDEAAQGHVSQALVLDVFSDSCRSSIDVALIAEIAFGSIGSDDNNLARRQLASQLVQRACQRDPLTAERMRDAGESYERH